MIPVPLTTGDVARYLHVSQFTVSKWIRQGKLNAYVTPGGHYRIRPDEFRSFLKRYRMPIDEEFFESRSSPHRILVVNSDAQAIKRIARTLSSNGIPVEVASANDDYEAGCQIVSFRPDLVIVDMSGHQLNGLKLCQQIKKHPASRHVKILALVQHTGANQIQRTKKAGADEVAVQPLDDDALLKKVHALLGAKNSH